MLQIKSGPGRRKFAGALLMAAIACDRAAASEVCAPEPQGEGRIAGLIDARTIRLDDGRAIRLAGLAAFADAPGATVLLSRHLGAKISLHADSNAPDRYGRQRAVAFVEGEDASLQIALIAAGAAAYDGVFDAGSCRDEFAAAETAARQARRGIWGSEPRAVLDAENPDEIRARIGQFQIIEGRVRTVRQAGGTSYLNFARRWTQGFAVTIPGRSVASFEAAGLGIGALEGRKIRVRGIVDVRGGPRIEASRPVQIELAGEESLATAGTRH